MPTYVYECRRKQCLHSFEIVQSIKDDSLIHCELCKHDSLKRVLQPVHSFSRGEAKTIEQQADRNTQRMGRYELEAKRHEASESRPKPKPHKRPWWRKTDKINTELAKLAPDVQIEKGKIVKSEPLSQKATEYIMKGDKA